VFHLRVDIVDVSRSCCQRLGDVVRRRRLSHPSGREFESRLTTETLVEKFRNHYRHVEHVESIEDLFVTLVVCDVRPTEPNRVSSMSRNTDGVVDVVDKEELVVEGDLIVALVLQLLDVIRVLMKILHVILVKLNDV